MCEVGSLRLVRQMCRVCGKCRVCKEWIGFEDSVVVIVHHCPSSNVNGFDFTSCFDFLEAGASAWLGRCDGLE